MDCVARMKTTKEHDQKLELYNQGLTDLEIAQQLNISVSNVNTWRRTHKLPLIKSKNRKISEEEEQKRLYFYNKGFSDTDIALKCGVTISAICAWRKDRKLKNNTTKKRQFLYDNYFLSSKVLET